MISYFYLLIRTLLLLALTTVLALFFLLFHEDVVPYLAQKYHKELGVNYEKIEGNLFYGVRIKGLSYKKGLHIEELELQYKLFKLFYPTPKIETLIIDGLRIDLAAFDTGASEDSTASSQEIPAFFLEKLILKQSEIKLEEKTIALNLEAKTLIFQKALDVEEFVLKLDTQYAQAQAKGGIKDSRLFAQVQLDLADILKEQYLKNIKNFPKKFSLDVALTQDQVDLNTTLRELTLQENEDIKLQEIHLQLRYPFATNNIFIDTNATLQAQGYEVLLKQKGSVTTQGDFVVNVQGRAKDLFSQTFFIDASGDKKQLKMTLALEQHLLALESSNYKEFDYIFTSPYLNANGLLMLQENMQTLQADITLKNIAPKFQNHKLSLEHTAQKTQLTLESLLVKLQLTREKNVLEGGGSIASNHFHLQGDLEQKELRLYSQIFSLHNFLRELDLVQKEQEMFYDAKIESVTTLSFAKELLIKSQVQIPWYKLHLDQQSLYQGEDLSLVLSYQDQQLFIDRYSTSFEGQKIFATKRSKLSLHKDQEILLHSLYINDTMLLSGSISVLEQNAALSLGAENFVYQSDDANVSMAVDIKADIDFAGAQKIEGEITFLEGEISYMPKEDYKITDEDIIIIQEIKEKEQTQREIALLIKSLKPLKYKNKNIDLEFTPELQLSQELHKALLVSGVVRIEKGEVNVSDRVFVFDASEIYFQGTEQINPQLNLNLHHYTLDNIDIEIYITHTMQDPVIIFSSKPAMSQEDILSYILFGERASSVFDTSKGGGDAKSSVSALLLGSGLKELLNQSDMLQVDTLNILTNEEGTLGYEIGAKLDKDFRIVYKNDTVSSVVLQYSLSRNIRLDVDVDETGQGVSILYVKDFSLKD